MNKKEFELLRMICSILVNESYLYILCGNNPEPNSLIETVIDLIENHEPKLVKNRKNTTKIWKNWLKFDKKQSKMVKIYL